MEASASQLFRAMDGLGTDEDAIHAALRGKSAAEVAEIRRIYQDHFGRSLDGDLGEELSGDELEAAQSALSGDRVQAAAAALVNAASGLGTDEATIHQTLEGITDPAQRAAVAAEYERRTGQSLDSMLAEELSDTDLAVAQSLSTGDRAGAAAARLDGAMNGGLLGGLGTDEDAVYAALEACRTPAERQAMADAYRARTGRALSADMDGEMGGAELNVATSLLAGDAAGAAAARMAVASDGLGTDEDAIFRQLEGKGPEERAAIIRAYNERYGAAVGGPSFDQMLSNELGDMDRERASQLAANGRLDPTFALRYAMDGVGTDEAMIRQSLEGKSAAEIDAIRTAYRERYGRDLDAEIAGENSGRDGFEIGQLMLGEPRTPEERLARMNAAYDFERGSGAGLIGTAVTDLFSDSGQVLDMQHRRLQELGERLQAGTATPEDLERLQTISNYQQQDVQNYQAARDAVTNTAAIGATAVVGTAATILTGGAAGPAMAAAIGALAGGAAGMAVKAGMQGDSYSNEDMAVDAGMAIVSAASAGLVQGSAMTAALNGVAGVVEGAAPTLMQTVVVEGLRGGATGLINGTAGGLLDENTWRGPGNGLAHFAQRVGVSTIGGAASGAGAGAAGNLMGPAAEGASRTQQIAWGAARGGVGGAVGSTVQSAVDPATWEGRWEDIAGRFGQGAVLGGLQGAIQGAADTRRDLARQEAARALIEGSEGHPLLPQATPEAEARVAVDNPEVLPVAADHPDAVPVVANDPVAGPIVAAEPELAPVLKDTPELAPVVAAAPELAEGLAARPDAPENQALADAARGGPHPATGPDAPITTDAPDARPGMTREEAWALAKAANDGDAAAQQRIADNLDAFLDAHGEARAARTDEGRALQGQREGFERALALSPEAQAAITPALDAMSEKAFDFLARMPGVDLATAVGNLGLDASTGLAGAIGTNPADMLDVLANGNVRERAIALGRFQEVLAAEALRPAQLDPVTGEVIRPSGLDVLRDTFAQPVEGGSAIQFGADDVARLEARVRDFQEANPGSTNVKRFLGAGTDDAVFAAAKGQNMDQKLPALPADVALAQLDGAPVQPGVSLTGAGEKSALARTTMTIAEAEAAGLQLSPRERAAAVANGDVLPWNVGTMANMVDPNSSFISGATDAAMPLKAGISGNTFRFLRAAETLGIDPALARLACMTQLIPIEAHSFHEIAMAAQDFQSPSQSYNPSLPYTPASTGLTDAQLLQIMLRAGMLPSDLNQSTVPSSP